MTSTRLPELSEATPVHSLAGDAEANQEAPESSEIKISPLSTTAARYRPLKSEAMANQLAVGAAGRLPQERPWF